MEEGIFAVEEKFEHRVGTKNVPTLPNEKVAELQAWQPHEHGRRRDSR